MCCKGHYNMININVLPHRSEQGGTTASWQLDSLFFSEDWKTRKVCRMDSFFSFLGSYIAWDVKSLLLFMIVFILSADYIKNRRPVCFPPGPWAVPILGNMFTVNHNRVHESLIQVGQQLSKIHP